MAVPEYDEPHYYIHDNGSRPFLVYLPRGTNKAIVYKVPSDATDFYVDHEDDNLSEERKLYREKVFETKFTRVFIGESPLDDFTRFGGGHGPNYKGNSILLHLNGLNYIHISACIKSFTALAPIYKYQASVGNNDVPYPFALDQYNRLYLMLDDVIMPNPPADQRHPYQMFYDKIEMLAHDCVNFDDKEYGDYNGFYIDGESYLHRWEPRPSEYYDMLLTRNRGSHVVQLSLRRKDGTMEPLTKERYIALNEQYGREHGFIPFHTCMIHDRV